MADGLARSGFDLDLAFGQAKESAFVQALREIRVECKADQKARVTGNIAIEIRQGSTIPGQGKLSGLSVTTARWWAQEIGDDQWIVVRVSLLKAIVRAVIQESTQNRLDPTKMVGDGNRYECVLVPIRRLITPVTVLRGASF